MAKITTITNPLTGQPAQVDQLDHTAQQIDDGISRALPGGAIDIALQNKAPAGLVSARYATSVESEVDTILQAEYAPMENRSLRFIVIDVNVQGEIFTGGAWHFTLYKTTDSFGVISATSYSNGVITGTELRKILYVGEWKDWCFVNPPMQLGEEYRTTERRNGLPVYTQFKNLGKIVNGAYGDISVTNLDSVVGYEAFWVNRPLPIIKNSSLTDAETQYLNVYVLNANTIRVYYYGGTSVSGNGDVYVLVKYTKST